MIKDYISENDQRLYIRELSKVIYTQKERERGDIEIVLSGIISRRLVVQIPNKIRTCRE